MTTSENKSLAGNIGWFWVFADVTRKLFENGPFANIYDAVADVRSKIRREELIAFCQVTKDDAGKRNYLTDIRCKIVTDSGNNTVVKRLPDQFDESYPLGHWGNIPETVDEIIFPYGNFIKIIASRRLSDFFGMIRRQEDEREAIRKQLLAEMENQIKQNEAAMDKDNANIVVAHIDKDDCVPTYYVFGENVRVFVVDENAPDDRVVEIKSRDTLEKISGIIPDGSDVYYDDKVDVFHLDNLLK